MPRRTLLLLLALGSASGIAIWLAADRLTLAWLLAHRDDLIAFCHDHMAVMVVAYCAVFIVCATLSVPGAASTLTLTAGMVFGLVPGVVLAATSATIGATGAFLIARHLLHDWVHARFARVFRIVDQGIARDGAFYLFMMRVVILFPFFVVNPVMGLTNMALRTFVVASFVGMLANTFVWVNAGTMLAKIDSLDDVLSMEAAVALALIGIVPLALRQLLHRRN